MDIGDIEQEQIDYIKRNGVFVEADEKFPDPLKAPLDVPVVLTKDQEERIVEDIRRQLQATEPGVVKKAEALNLSSFISTLTKSFVGIMDDLLNFSGNMEELPEIFTKDNRMVFVASVLIIISFAILGKSSS